MADYLIDSDVLIDHLRRRHRFEPDSDPVLYSVITRCELFAGRATDEAVVGRLLDTLHELPVDRPIAERAGRIRRTTGIAIADALIAATALEHQLTLLTRNVKHFLRVPELAIGAPRETRWPE